MQIFQTNKQQMATLRKKKKKDEPARKSHHVTLEHDRELLRRRPPEGGVHRVRAQDAEQLLHRLHLAAADQAHGERSRENEGLTGSQVGGASYLQNRLAAGVQRQVQRVADAVEVWERGGRGPLLQLRPGRAAAVVRAGQERQDLLRRRHSDPADQERLD